MKKGLFDNLIKGWQNDLDLDEIPDKNIVFRMSSIFTQEEFDEIKKNSRFKPVENSEFIYKKYSF